MTKLENLRDKMASNYAEKNAPPTTSQYSNWDFKQGFDGGTATIVRETNHLVEKLHEARDDISLGRYQSAMTKLKLASNRWLKFTKED